MSTAMLTIPNSLLAAEMWTSLRALVASHVAMYAVAEPQRDWKVSNNDAETISIRNVAGVFHWHAPDSMGTGIWKFAPARAKAGSRNGLYEFTEEGRLRVDISEQPLEMDAAVELQLRHMQETERRA